MIRARSLTLSKERVGMRTLEFWAQGVLGSFGESYKNF